MKTKAFAMVGVLSLVVCASLFRDANNASAQAPPTPEEKHDQLVARNYQGHVRFRVKNGNTYVTPDGNQNGIILSGGAFAWRTVFAVYTGHNSHYWVYRRDGIKRAWQVNPQAPNNNLAFWNYDGLAQGNPEDWEEFDFENAGGMDVRIRSVINGRYMVANGNRLEVSALQNAASIFTTEFP